MSDPAVSDHAANDRAASEASYDATGLRVLQDQLRRLNAAARAEGLFGDALDAALGFSDEAAPKPLKTARMPSKAASKRGKAAARRLLELAGRREDDDSPDVSGTHFTEAGVVRLLVRLRRRADGDGAWPRFLGRVQRALGRPVAAGQLMVAGVSLARLQTACRQLLEVEMHGLAHLAARRAIRRGRLLQANALKLDVEAAPSKAAPSKAEQPKTARSKAAPSKTLRSKRSLSKQGDPR